jgi:hypothetical protein
VARAVVRAEVDMEVEMVEAKEAAASVEVMGAGAREAVTAAVATVVAMAVGGKEVEMGEGWVVAG